MNFDNYRRAMDENKLSDEKKAILMGYAEATPLHGSQKFEKLKRRKKAKIVSLASLAACFTIVCLTGVPLLFFGLSLRAGNAEAPETNLEATSSRPPWYLMDQEESDKNTIVTGALPENFTATEATLATAASNGANSGVSGYRDIYLMMQTSQSPTEDSQKFPGRTEDEAQTTTETEIIMPNSVIISQSYSASASDSFVTITSSLGEEKTLVYGESTKILALYAYDNCLIVCSEIEEETVAFVYALTDTGDPKLLGDLSVSGNMLDASFEGNILTVTTEFSPSMGNVTDYAAYIPGYTANGKTWLVAAEDCVVTNSSSGEYTCFVVIEIELAEKPTILSVKAEFTEKISAGANKK